MPQQYDSDKLRASGKRGGDTTARKYGPLHYSAMGKRGGQATKERHGTDYYRAIGAKGGSAFRKKRGAASIAAAPTEAAS